MTALTVCLICVFVQVLLTFTVMFRMGTARIKSVRAKDVTIADIALDSAAYPLHVQKLQNNFRNQMETPILFYVLITLGAAVNALNWGVALASVGYVAMRIVHYVIHTGSNHVGRRFKVFFLGFIFLMIGWASLGIGLLGIV